MKQLLITLLAISAFSVAHAQSSTKILTVDGTRLYSSYWKVQEGEAKFQSSVENAQQEVQTMSQDIESKAQQARTLQQELSSPAISDERKTEITQQLQREFSELQRMQAELNQFQQSTDARLQQRQQSFVQLRFQEIQEVVADIAKSKGADLVINTRGSNVFYANEALDITDEVIPVLNADKPAN